MLEIRKCQAYDTWFAGLRDFEAAARINVRIRRLSLGHPGDVRPVGEGVSVLRIDYGPGYRAYYVQRRQIIVVLLCGGVKKTQDRGIAKAKILAKDWTDDA